MPRRGHLHALVLAAAFVGPTFTLQHWSPTTGLPLALGCSGGGNVPTPTEGWVDVNIYGNPLEARAVATDGFFVISATGLFSEGVDALELLTVTVTTSEGASVAGELQQLNHGGSWYQVGWSATDPVADGSALTAEVVASFGALAPLEAHATLEVSGAPTTLSAQNAGSLRLDDWVKYGRGVGQGATCVAAMTPGSCAGTRTLQLPASDERYRAANAWWVPPQVNGFVAWEARVEQEDESAGALFPAWYQGGVAPTSQQHFGKLALTELIEEYCATLIVRDLRTDEEVSTPFCGAVEETHGTELDYPLAQCAELPGSAYLERWCELYPSKPECQTPGSAGSGTGGSGGTGGSSSTSGGGAAVSGNAASGAGLGATPPPSRTTEGCHVAAPASRGGGAVAALGLAFAALLRAARRRERETDTDSHLKRASGSDL